MAPELTHREPVASDLNFIYDSFLKTVKSNKQFSQKPSNRVFFPEMQKIIDRILASSKTIITCLKEDPNVIVGYLIYSDQTLQFCFVKQPWWGLGIAKAMFNEAFQSPAIQYAFITDMGEDIAKCHPEFVFNPYVNFQKLNTKESHEQSTG